MMHSVGNDPADDPSAGKIAVSKVAVNFFKLTKLGVQVEFLKDVHTKLCSGQKAKSFLEVGWDTLALALTAQHLTSAQCCYWPSIQSTAVSNVLRCRQADR